MLFNLISPLISRENQDLAPLRVAFSKHNIRWPEAQALKDLVRMRDDYLL